MTLQDRIRVSTEPEPYRFTQRDYLLLDESGAFGAYTKTELIEGVIVAVNAQYSRHARVQTKLLRALADACDAIEGGPQAWVEGSIDIDEASMPQPDILVTDVLPDNGAVPLSTVRLVIEVADTSLKNDLTVKARLYAIAGVPEYWVADVNAQLIHQMWQPDSSHYVQRIEVPFGNRIEARTVPGLAIETASL